MPELCVPVCRGRVCVCMVSPRTAGASSLGRGGPQPSSRAQTPGQSRQEGRARELCPRRARNFSRLRDGSGGGCSKLRGALCLGFPICKTRRADWGGCLPPRGLAEGDRPFCLKREEQSSSWKRRASPGEGFSLFLIITILIRKPSLPTPRDQ